MKKTVLWLAALPLLLLSCVENDTSFKEYQRVAKGVGIYSMTSIQNRMAMQPVDMALRLGVLDAEAEAQRNPETGVRPALTTVTVDRENIFQRFFGSNGRTTIETTDGGGYKLTFARPMQAENSIMCRGTIVVSTGGKLLSETDASSPWTVTPNSDFRVLVYSGSDYDIWSEVAFAVRAISIYRSNASTYRIEVLGAAASFEAGSAFVSDWNAHFTLTPPTGAEGLAFSKIEDRTFRLDGQGSGPSAYTIDNATSVVLDYRVTGGLYYGSQQIVGGKEDASFEGTNPNYPSNEVSVEWSLSSQGRYLVQTISYNGYTWSNR